ncbi:YciI family protein, partial [Mesorhizobium sp.]
MFIVSLNYKVPLTEIDRLAPAHVEWLKACYAEGIFVASGPKRPRTGGIIV